MSNDMKCSFWKHRFDAKWVQKKYIAMKERGSPDVSRVLEVFDKKLTND
jgi:hypothetical protein